LESWSLYSSVWFFFCWLTTVIAFRPKLRDSRGVP
jgi:hypothetical protein